MFSIYNNNNNNNAGVMRTVIINIQCAYNVNDNLAGYSVCVYYSTCIRPGPSAVFWQNFMVVHNGRRGVA